MTNGHVEAAKLLAMNGIDLTDEEKGSLGGRYTNFQQALQQASQSEQEGKRQG